MAKPLQGLRERLLEQLADASRHVDIASPHLEPALFDSDAVASGLTALARRGAQTRIRLLIEEDQPGAYEFHRLVALSRRLSTAISLRVLPEHPEWNRETIVVVDRACGLIVNPAERKSQVLDTRVKAQRWAETFERLWHAGRESQELRQFY